MPVPRIPAALCGALVLLAGCGSDAPVSSSVDTTAPTPPTSTVVVPSASPTPTPTTPGTAPRLPPRRATSGSRAAYLQRLDTLAGRVQAALGKASRTQDSRALAALDEAIMQATTDWRTGGGASSPAAAALTTAMATAISNLESPLLLGESRRQLAAARRALAAERAAAR